MDAAGYHDLTPRGKTRPCAASPLRETSGATPFIFISPLREAGGATPFMSPLREAGGTRPFTSPLREAGGARPYMPSLSTPSSRDPAVKQCYGDRFIPYRGSAMDLDIGRYLLTEPRKGGKENAAAAATPRSPSSQLYRKLLAEKLLNNRTRVLTFRNNPPEHVDSILAESSIQAKPKPRRVIPQTPERMLDAPDLVDDYCLNLLDWGSRNVLSIALGNTIYLWDATTRSISELATVHQDDGPVTSVSWAPDGRHLAVRLTSSVVQLWDSTSNQLVRTLQGVHRSRVGSLAWKNSKVLTSGGMEGEIVNSDVRIRSRAAAQTYHGHAEEVRALKWSGSGQRLASGGNDNLVLLWDASVASSSSAGRRTQWLHKLEDHSAAVKGLAWCPFQSNLLASGGGTDDRCIKFWNTNTGACLNSVDTGSQVSALLWNKNDRELLSAHGFGQNQLTLVEVPVNGQDGRTHSHQP